MHVNWGISVIIQRWYHILIGTNGERIARGRRVWLKGDSLPSRIAGRFGLDGRYSRRGAGGAVSGFLRYHMAGRPGLRRCYSRRSVGEAVSGFLLLDRRSDDSPVHWYTGTS